MNKMRKVVKLYCGVAVRFAIFILALSPCAFAADLNQPPINYEKTKPDNEVSRLQKSIDNEKVELVHDKNQGYLKSVLSALKIPESSQVLVYSKTSLQRHRIAPRTPRAIYFNDEVTVGFCQRGDMLEIMTADPKLGAVFYTLDQNPEKPRDFVRQNDSCLNCHASSANQEYPGHLVRSVSADSAGQLVLSLGSKRVDHTTPFADRWGGWYVTGTSGKQSHQGNRIVGGWGGENPEADGSNVTDLKPYIDVKNYLTPHSDLIALMVLEHQGEVHNRIVRANFQTRQALLEQTEINKALGKPKDERFESTTRRIHSACEYLVKHLLFCEEAPLTEEVAGTSDFAKEFAARGPFDSKGRSLREFNLKNGLFRYPMSYLIYTQAFDGLPVEAKDRVYLRLWEVVSGKDQTKDFAHLSEADRKAIREILTDTKKGLPSYWTK